MNTSFITFGLPILVRRIRNIGPTLSDGYISCFRAGHHLLLDIIYDLPAVTRLIRPVESGAVSRAILRAGAIIR